MSAPMAVCPTCGRSWFTPVKWDEHCTCGTDLGAIFTPTGGAR